MSERTCRIFATPGQRYAGQRLAGDIVEAIGQYLGDVVHGPWEDLVHLFVDVVERGEVTLEQAARMDHLLRRTRGDEGRSGCGTCLCPVPGLSHREHD